MILNIISNPSLTLEWKILWIIFGVVASCLAISIHESFHGIAALAMGDDTAKIQGRISLNPFRHLNLAGTLMLVLVGFGWANPVQVNPNNFKNRKAGTVVTSLAGPLSNLIFAFVGTFLYTLFLNLSFQNNSDVLFNISYFFYIFASLNIGFAIFNLIPIPPLDGSKVVAECLPFNAKYKYLSVERYSFIIFIALLLIMRYFNFLSPILSGVFNAFFALSRSILSLFF